MSKYTPGPWRVCGGYTASYTAITTENDGYIVYGMADRLDHKEREEPINAPDYETQRANAKLIAAAPDLLAACKDAFNYVTNDILLKQLEAAIAKAEGK